jgi:cytochrome c-type biogenesis protein CcmH/NrfG
VAGDAAGAREAAERALQAAPRDPASWIAAGRAAAALGDGATARSELSRAVKLAGKGPRAAEAKRLLAGLPKR